MRFTLFLLAILFTVSGNAQEIKVDHGTLRSYNDFPSKFVEKRNIDIWLPDGYSADEKFPVLYMHDGQMLFDANTTWNKQAWDVESVATKLMKQGKIQKFIVVGISAVAQNRRGDYFPQKPFESLSKKVQDSIYNVKRDGNPVFTSRVNSDNYLLFIVKELKPYIDQNFSTKSDQPNTFIAGSSMGGLISLYAICEYPEVFGGAACISTHWPGVTDAPKNPIPAAFMKYLEQNLPSPKDHKLYFDYGTKTQDAAYGPYQKMADKILTEKGYTAKNRMSREFPGADHSELSWNARLHVPLEFLLAK